MSEAKLGKPTWNKGKKLSKEHKEKLSVAHAGLPSHWKGKKRPENSGANNNMWKGGITPINAAVRTSAEYKNWRISVFNRDDFRCQACGIRGGELHADHELPFAYFPALRFEVLNGRTLCKPCHRKTDTWQNGRQIKELMMIGFPYEINTNV